MGPWIVESVLAALLALIAIPLRSAVVYGLEISTVLFFGSLIMVFPIGLGLGLASPAFKLRHLRAIEWATRVPPVAVVIVWSYYQNTWLILPALVVCALHCYFYWDSDNVIRQRSSGSPKLQ